MDGFITITDKVVKFIVNTGTGKNYKEKTKWTNSEFDTILIIIIY